MKRAISAVLAAVVLALNFAACDSSPKATPASSFSWHEKGGVYRLTKFIGSETNVIIPSKVNGVEVKTVALMAFQGTSIESVVVPDSVTLIEDYAFDRCDNLKSIIFGKGVTVLKANTVTYCRSLESVTFMGEVEKVYPEAFTHIKSVTFYGSKMPDFGGLAFPLKTEIKYKKGASGWSEYVQENSDAYTFVEF